jgi:tetratricopeptide (TPR) repeat protein
MSEDREAALALSWELGGLPLALDQAGAFIEASITPTEYLRLYREHGSELRERHREPGPAEHAPVTATFGLAFDKMAAASEAAAELLRLCAFLGPQAIPEDIILAGAPELGELLARAASNPVLWVETVQQAGHYSLLRRDQDARTLSLHRLVQAVIRDQMEPKTRRIWAERAVRAVSRVFPAPRFENWHACERLLPHAMACATWIKLENMKLAEAAQLLNETGSYLRERTQYAEALPLLQDALTIRTQVFGSTHPYTAESLNHLAGLCHNQRRYEEAERHYQQALAIREQMLSIDHPRTAETLNGLALLHHDRGHFPEAERLYERALTIYEQALGADHPDAATVLHGLAQIYRFLNRDNDAEPLYRRALRIFEQAFGRDHPHTAQVLNDFARLYQDQGNYAEAEALNIRALATLERVLGPHHPHTITTRNNYLALMRLMDRDDRNATQ